jgi:sialidase-1
MRFFCLIIVASAGILCGCGAAVKHHDQATDVQTVLCLEPSPDNPRNSEGDFIQLKNGALLFIYTRFVGGDGDDATAVLAQRSSGDRGQTWTQEDVVAVANENAMNIMSVSLLRLKPDTLALFYLRKNSWNDCRPVFRLSGDEAKSWGQPQEVFPGQESDYYVLNNDRVVRLTNGRLLLPLAQHYAPGWPEWNSRAQILCAYSDNDGRSWKKGQTLAEPELIDGKKVTLQEPGLVELKDHRLLLFCRTDAGSQYIAYSGDLGETWSRLQPSNIISPLSPASIARIPNSGDLLLVWNDHKNIDPSRKEKRTPFHAAISGDDGITWTKVRTIADNPDGWYCYTAIEFVDRYVLLAYCAGDRRFNNGLALTRISRMPLSFFYENAH